MKIEDEIRQKEFQSACQKTGVNFLFSSLRMREMYARFFKRHEIANQQFNALTLHGQHPKPFLARAIIRRVPDREADFSPKKLFLIL